VLTQPVVPAAAGACARKGVAMSLESIRPSMASSRATRSETNAGEKLANQDMVGSLLL
jgi:hypothetical protein